MDGIKGISLGLDMVLNNYIKKHGQGCDMSPGIGLMKRRLEKEKDAISLAVSGVAKKYNVMPDGIDTLETKYDDDTGDWYVALGWNEIKAIVRMDSVQGTVTEIKKIETDVS